MNERKEDFSDTDIQYLSSVSQSINQSLYSVVSTVMERMSRYVHILLWVAFFGGGGRAMMTIVELVGTMSLGTGATTNLTEPASTPHVAKKSVWLAKSTENSKR